MNPASGAATCSTRCAWRTAGSLSSREGVDLLIALNQETVTLHHQELSPQGLIIYDASEVKELPGGRPSLALSPENLLPGAAGKAEIAVNAGACGAVLGLLKAPLAPLLALLQETFADKGGEVVEWNVQAATRGYEQAGAQDYGFSLAEITPAPEPRLLISGHEAMALGALAGGLQFISGYPMTPWTSLLNAVALRAGRYNVVVEQAEDEIAAINLAIGASYAGARSLTGTSGGGFCLMTEALGLAAMTETPLVIVVSMRPGPSTGLPTRTRAGGPEFCALCRPGGLPPGGVGPRHPGPGFRPHRQGPQSGRPLSITGDYPHRPIFRGHPVHPHCRGIPGGAGGPGPDHRSGAGAL